MTLNAEFRGTRLLCRLGRDPETAFIVTKLYYPDGADRPVRAYDVRFNTALVMDTDSVFHGVDRVTETDRPMPTFLPRMRLQAEGDGNWIVRDEAERETWKTASGDLSIDTVLGTLCDDLRERGRLEDTRPPNRELAEILVGEYVKFPPPAAF